jgi:beta-glucosidase
MPSLTWMLLALCLSASMAACGGPGEASTTTDASGDVGETTPALALTFPAGFRFGAATSAHQVEGGQHNTWTQWESLPAFEGKTAEPSGMACDHYNRYEEDLDLIAGMGLDVYRMSIEWSRIEPTRGQLDPAEIEHYRAVFEAMRARGVQPSVTLHHFTEPTWFMDLSRMTPPFDDTFCAEGPTEEDLCGWVNPESVTVFAAFCGLMAREFGEHVDEWWTINEPTGIWTAGMLSGDFPPGLTEPIPGATLAKLEERALPALRNLISAHAACYDAIHAEDTHDADDDGHAARVGLTIGTGRARPADPDKPQDVAAAEQAEWVGALMVFDAVTRGELDADFDMVPDEPHPDWEDRLDLIGLQYYASSVVIGDLQVSEMLWGTPCINLDNEPLMQIAVSKGCPPPPTDDFPMGDEPEAVVYGKQHDPWGLVELLETLDRHFPGVPVVITENGFANHDDKRAYSIVRHLQACHEAISRGLPLEGYYHWSLLDNFEWGHGYATRFGLYHVDPVTLARSPSPAVDVYRDVATRRGLSEELLTQLGGDGALPETLPDKWAILPPPP